MHSVRVCLGVSMVALGGSGCTSQSAVDASAIDAMDAAVADLGADAGSMPPGDAACTPHPWHDDGGTDAPLSVTNIRQLVSNCRHNENTDLITYHNAIYLIHRTYDSQVLSPDARLHLYRSDDQGATFTDVHEFSYPGRDIRDPKLMVVGDELRVYSLSRLPGFMAYDNGTDTLTTVARSPDGMQWSDPTPVYDAGWSFWREVQVGAMLYAAAYEDGDRSIIFLQSTDGLTWQRTATVFNDACRIPLEPEPIFFPDGRVVVAIRMDDGDNYLDDGHEKLCVADPPYTSFTCPGELPGRLDGPRVFTYGSTPDRYVIARAHLPLIHKRTVVYRFTGNLHDAVGVGLELVATLPSAGDTSYAGLTWLSTDHALISWYTSNPAVSDPPWWYGSLNATDIFLATLDLSGGVGPGTPFVRDAGVGPCRPLDDGGLLFPDAAVDATTGP